MKHSRWYDFQGHPRSGSRWGDDLSPLSGLFLFKACDIWLGLSSLESDCTTSSTYTEVTCTGLPPVSQITRARTAILGQLARLPNDTPHIKPGYVRPSSRLANHVVRPGNVIPVIHMLNGEISSITATTKHSYQISGNKLSAKVAQKWHYGPSWLCNNNNDTWLSVSSVNAGFCISGFCKVSPSFPKVTLEVYESGF